MNQHGWSEEFFDLKGEDAHQYSYKYHPSSDTFAALNTTTNKLDYASTVLPLPGQQFSIAGRPYNTDSPQRSMERDAKRRKFDHNTEKDMDDVFFAPANANKATETIFASTEATGLSERARKQGIIDEINMFRKEKEQTDQQTKALEQFMATERECANELKENFEKHVHGITFDEFEAAFEVFSKVLCKPKGA